MGQCRRLEVCLLLMSCAAGCGGGGGGAMVRLEDPAACKAAWQPVTSPQPFDVTSGLVYQAGTLYYSSLNNRAILAVPTDGSAPGSLAAVAPSELWVEDDHLLFAGGDLANQIFSLPLAGGTPQLVLDGGAGRTSPGVAMAHAFNATDFYWVEQVATASSTVWHQSRSGGSPEQIGATDFTVPGGPGYPARAIALTGDSVVVGADFGEAGTLPMAGGDVTLLATPTESAERNAESDLAGLAWLGAFWSVPSLPGQPASLMLSTVDGSPAVAFWAGQPVSTEPTRIWPNPEGGWIVASFQFFADGRDHMTIWSMDAQGTATRLGCSPGPGGDSWIEKGVAIAPDAVYVAAENLSASTWQIDRIAR